MSVEDNGDIVTVWSSDGPMSYRIVEDWHLCSCETKDIVAFFLLFFFVLIFILPFGSLGCNKYNYTSLFSDPPIFHSLDKRKCCIFFYTDLLVNCQFTLCLDFGNAKTATTYLKFPVLSYKASGHESYTDFLLNYQVAVKEEGWEIVKDGFLVVGTWYLLTSESQM